MSDKTDLFRASVLRLKDLWLQVVASCGGVQSLCLRWTGLTRCKLVATSITRGLVL